MALPEKNEIAPDLLYVFVVGPGTGETVLILIPPERWVIIDSFKYGRPSRPAAGAIVSRYGGKVTLLALTHPHRDHYPGFLDLIDRYGDAVIGCVHPGDSSTTGYLPTDAMAALKEGVKPTYTRIWDEWTVDPTRRWDTFRGMHRFVGEALVTALHPVRPVNPAHWGHDSNSISSAMLVEWRGLRLLLGADVPNTEWPGIGADFPGLSTHAAMKVPHHGSREAIHEIFADGTPGRVWVITPFGRLRLPRADDFAATGTEPEGLNLVLSSVSQVRLTSLPFRHQREFESPCMTTRGEIRDKTHPVPSNIREEAFMATDAPLDRQIVVAFDRNGRLVNGWYGCGSALVSP